MNKRVNAVGLAVVPPNPALAVSFSGVFLILAVLAMDGSEPLGGSELHPPRFLWLVAYAACEEATGVSRLVVARFN